MKYRYGYVYIIAICRLMSRLLELTVVQHLQKIANVNSIAGVASYHS